MNVSFQWDHRVSCIFGGHVVLSVDLAMAWKPVLSGGRWQMSSFQWHSSKCILIWLLRIHLLLGVSCPGSGGGVQSSFDSM